MDESQVRTDITNLHHFWMQRNLKFQDWYEVLLLIDILKSKGMETYVSNEPMTFYNMAHYLLTKGELSHTTPIENENALELDRRAKVHRGCEYMWKTIDRERQLGGEAPFIDDLSFFLLVLGWYSVVELFDKDTGLLHTKVWNPYDTYPRYADNKLSACVHSYKMPEIEAVMKAESKGWSYEKKRTMLGEVSIDDYFLKADDVWYNMILIDNKDVTGWVKRDDMQLLVSPVGGFPDRGSLTKTHSTTASSGITRLPYGGTSDWRRLTGRGIFEVNMTVSEHFNKWKCVHPDTFVWMHGEGLVPIIEVKEGQYTQSTSGRDKVDAVHTSDIMDALKIRTYQGFELTCSTEHRFLLPDGSYKQAGDLRVGDNVLSSYNNQIFGRKTVISPYVLGLLVGDGSFATEGYIGFTNQSYDLCKLVADMFSGSIKKHERKNTYQVNIYSYRDTMKELWGIPTGRIKASQKEVPPCILQSGKVEQLQFIKGLFDTDGHYDKSNGNISFDLSSYKLLQQLQLLLANLGILSRLTKLKGKEAWRLYCYGEDSSLFCKLVCPQFSHSFAKKSKWLHKESKKKYYLDKRWIYEDKIISIESVDGGIFYDLSIHGIPNYIANGIVVHNSMISQILRDTAQPITQEFSSSPQASPEQLRERGALFHYSPGESGLNRVPPPAIPIEIQANLLELRREYQKGSFNDAVYGMVEGQPGYALSLLASSSANQILYPYMDGKHFVISESDRFWLSNLKSSKRVFQIKGKFVEKLSPTDIPEGIMIDVQSSVATPKDWMERGTIAGMLDKHFDRATILSKIYEEDDPQAIIRRKRLEQMLDHPMSIQLELISAWEAHAKYLGLRGDAKGSMRFLRAARALESQMGAPAPGQGRPEEASRIQAAREAGTPEERARVNPEVAPPEARSGFTPQQMRRSIGRGAIRRV